MIDLASSWASEKFVGEGDGRSEVDRSTITQSTSAFGGVSVAWGK